MISIILYHPTTYNFINNKTPKCGGHSFLGGLRIYKRIYTIPLWHIISVSQITKKNNKSAIYAFADFLCGIGTISDQLHQPFEPNAFITSDGTAISYALRNSSFSIMGRYINYSYHCHHFSSHNYTSRVYCCVELLIVIIST